MCVVVEGGGGAQCGVDGGGGAGTGVVCVCVGGG